MVCFMFVAGLMVSAQAEEKLAEEQAKTSTVVIKVTTKLWWAKLRAVTKALKSLQGVEKVIYNKKENSFSLTASGDFKGKTAVDELKKHKVESSVEDDAEKKKS